MTGSSIQISTAAIVKSLDTQATIVYFDDEQLRMVHLHCDTAKVGMFEIEYRALPGMRQVERARPSTSSLVAVLCRPCRQMAGAPTGSRSRASCWQARLQVTLNCQHRLVARLACAYLPRRIRFRQS